MALAGYYGVAVDDAGNVQASPTVEVRRLFDNGLQSLFSNRAGTVSIGNSFTGNLDGSFEFYCAGGAYKITVTKGALTRIIPYVAIGTSAESDATLFLPEEGLWTPTIELFTPGDMTVFYSSQLGEYQRIGQWVEAWFFLSGSIFTTTGSGQVTIGGLPYAASHDYVGTLLFSGVNKSETNSPLQAWTQFCCVTATDFTSLAIECSGNGLPISNLQKPDLPFIDSPPQNSFAYKGNIRYHTDD